jgi:hypothetical protein
VFASGRYEHVRVKGSLSSTTAMLMMFKLGIAASKTISFVNASFTVVAVSASM